MTQTGPEAAERGAASDAAAREPGLEPGRAQLLDLAQHLIEYSALLLLISGPKGQGKTTLARYLRTACADRHRVCEVAAGGDLTPELLLRRLATCIGLAEEAARDAAALEQALRSLGQQAVVLVDDAQDLPREVLTLLAGFGAGADDAPDKPVRVVLFADETLDAAALPSAEGVHRLAIPAFPPAHTELHIEQRLAALGEVPAAPRIRAAAKQIHRRAEGVPGRIEAQLDALLLEGAAGDGWRVRLQAVPAALRTRLPRPRPLAIGGIAVAGLLVVGALVLPGGEREASTTVELTLPDVAPLPPPARAGDPPPAVAFDGPSAAAQLDPTQAPDLAAPPVEDVAEAQAARERIAQAMTLPVVLPSPPVDGAADEAATAPEAQRSAVAPPAPAAAPAAVAPPGGPRALRDAQWLAQRDADHYTLQLLAASSPQALHAYVARKGLTGDIAVIPSVRGGAPWYTLVLGDYPDRASAQQAAQRLRPQLDEAPWVRRLGGLQASVDAPAAAPATTPAPRAAPAAATAPAATPERDAQAAGSAGRGAGWLWAQDPRRYTLQLMGSRSEAAIRRAIARHGIEREAAYFIADHQGEPWYVLIHGSYASAEEARAAVAGLPKALRDASPWARSFSDVQQSVRLE